MFIADFHIHSKYSRATSRQCNPEMLEMWARRKGIDVVGTGDFTHPAWREELKEKLVPSGEGLYTLKDEFCIEDKVAGGNFKPRFVVSGEISSIYKKNGRVRKVHNLIILPGLEQAESLSRRLETVGNLHSDGRPILGLDSRVLLEMVLEVCPDAIFIPAHIWTPHFSLYGAYSGFDDIRECFDDLTGFIYALETGLSSNPPMNWRLSALDGFTLISNSDAHSPMNLGREANIFYTELSYMGILRALKDRGTNDFYGTIEFFPEEGKYHYDGHRKCKVCWKPSDTKAAGGICPVCGGRITIGVLHRVEALADRPEGFRPSAAKPFESLVPLHEVIASSIGSSASSVKVKRKYEDMIHTLGPEFYILRRAPLKDIELLAGPYITEGIRRLRCGEIEIKPGYDGEYGKIKIMDKNEINMLSGQLCFVNGGITHAETPSAPGNTDSIRIAPAKAESAPVSVDGSSRGDNMDGYRNNTLNTLYELNREQWEAVSTSSPATAVIAGPGTGKTKTLVCRIAYLVEKCGMPPSHITAVTFTNKAANEMRTRLKEHFGNGRTANEVTIGTFHSICLQLLSIWKDTKNLAIIDEYTAVSIIEEILKNIKSSTSPKDVKRCISLIKNGAARKEDYKDNFLAQVYNSYCSRLKSYGLMDYDDILLEVLRRFECNDARNISEIIPERFSHLLVDEFQDINEIQYRLIKECSKKSESVFFIGDPDQAIYGFRGSDSRYFEKLKQDYPGIRYVRLTRNYRSTPEIIVSAESVISKKTASNRSRPLHAIRESGARVRLIKANDEFSEAVYIAKEINRMVGGIDMIDAQALSGPGRKRHASRHTLGFSDIAVLYRTNNQAEILEQCLSKEGIQYVVLGRDEFLSDKPVRETIAFFRFLLNPGDIASLLVCLKAESIYSEDLHQKVLEDYAAGEKSVSALTSLMEGAELSLDKADRLGHFLEILRKYEPVVHKEKPGKIIDSWICDRSLSGLRCMELLLNTAVMYDKMSSLIQNLLLGRESDVVRSASKVYYPDAVRLMTMHAAKGLEFPAVFIYGANDGTIPLRNSGSDFDMDEERRLFYVGMTRARDELILVTSRTPSPFIADIPEEQLMTENATAKTQASQYKQASLFEI